MQNSREIHPADLAEKLSQMDTRERNIEFLRLSPEQKSDVFPHLDQDIREDLIRALGDKQFAEVLNNLEPDDRTALLEHFPDALIKHSVNLLNDEEKEVALNLIGYPKNCIARLMTPYYIQSKEDWTVAQTLAHIKKHGKKAETLTYIYIVDENNKLTDDLAIGEILLAEPDEKLSALTDHSFISLQTTESTEDSFSAFEKYDRGALPIVTENGTLVGIVTLDDIVDKIKERDTEDILKFGGMEGIEVSYTRTPLAQLVKKRASWLIILFIGEMLTASAMGYFDDEIEKAVVLALFVPLIISSGGNSGSQAASLIIRAMALQEVKLSDWWYVFKKECFSGLLLGSILAVIGFIRICIWQELGLFDYGTYWIPVAITVSLSLLFIVLWGTLSGSLIPFLLRKIKLDPATASAPFVATLVDVTGLIIYFSIASIILQGKLL